MNEQRQQAYLDLIEKLLSCPSEEVVEILEANEDLLDADFLLMLEVVAEYMSQQGHENAANWLRNLANQLGEALNLSSSTAANTSEEDLQAYWQFLMTVLQATAESEGDARVVYPLLANNTQYLNRNLAEVLRRWATNYLAEVDTEAAQSIAGVIIEFSNLIREFPWGDKASNIEIAIAGYEVVLSVFTREAFPQNWATTQHNLATACSERILGDKAQNIELAIASYTNALSVRTRDAFGQQWAMTQNNLATAYSYRILGDKAQNIEMAIASYTNALSVRSRDALPQDWASTQNNLAAAYSERILGDKAQNIELAIASYTNALSVYTRQAFPQNWTMTQNKAKTLSYSRFHHLFAIQNPTKDLEFTDIEVETIAAAFHPRHILKKNQATAAALAQPTTAEHFRNANWLHFSCHGYFNIDSPEKSALLLAASEISHLPAEPETSRYLRVSDDTEIDLENCLTLEDIFQLSLPNCRLVTLSACETGLVDIRNTSDEYIGLPSDFIRAGAASIVSSLWTVNDFSTALLMIKFYENLQTVTPNVPIALNSAQQWLRRVTQRELLQWLDNITDMNAEQKQKVKEILGQDYKPEERPFKQPFSWAAFCAIGE